MINTKKIASITLTAAAASLFALAPMSSGAAQEQPQCGVHKYLYSKGRTGFACRVPQDTHRIYIVAGGGQGGYGSANSGGPGRGILIEGMVPVNPGEILQIWVGSHASGYHRGTGWEQLGPDDSGGTGGSGGSSGTGASAKGGGGGGASAVAGSVSGVLIVAGGGGGAGGQGGFGADGGNGGNGGLNPGNGTSGETQVGAGGRGGKGGQSGKSGGGDGQDANSAGASGGGGGGGGGYIPAKSGAATGGGARGDAGQNLAGGGGGGGGTSYIVPSATGVKESPPLKGKGVDGFVEFRQLHP
jgi:hypothetical protein